MSLLSTFVTTHVLTLLEKELLNHEADIQAAMLAEVKVLADTITSWVNDKLAAKQA